MGFEKFDPEKDVMVKEIGVARNERGAMTCGVFRYNNGQPKVGFQRTITRPDGSEQFVKPGRLTIEEAVVLSKALRRMAKAVCDEESGEVVEDKLNEWLVTGGKKVLKTKLPKRG